MKPSLRAAFLALLVLTLISSAVPAGAHDPQEFEEGHSGPGSAGPDEHSKNVKLLSNVPRTGQFTQSDLAFAGNLAFSGNYGGFRVIDIADPEAPQIVSDFRCNGAQGDVSIHRNLLFQSVDSPQTTANCNSTSTRASTPGAFEGIRIFDVSDPAAPVHVASVATDCGSHTHSLVPQGDRAVLYVSSYPLGGAAIGPNCQSPHGFVSIVDVPISDPASASVSKYDLDGDTELASYFGGAFTFRACHDISVFTGINRAAAACLSEAQVWDISDPLHPQFLYRFDDPVVNTDRIDLWHSATFSWDGSVVAFGDESGGGGSARCTDPTDQQGRIWFLDAATGELQGNYKIPRSESGTCTSHNFNFIPLTGGRKVLVGSNYTGGTTVVDVTDPTKPTEIGFYKPSGANTWSSYWYNGFIYGNDILRGLDIFLLSDKARAGARKLDVLNPQTQVTPIF
jgi:hypothetical protein